MKSYMYLYPSIFFSFSLRAKSASMQFLCAFMLLFFYTISLQAEYVSDSSMVLLRNQDIIPIQDLDKKSIAVLTYPSRSLEAFSNMSENYCPIEKIKALGPDNTWDLLVMGVDVSQTSPTEWAIIQRLLPNLDNYIVVFFGDAKELGSYSNLTELPALLTVGQADVHAQEQAMQVLFGALGVRSRLTHNIGTHFQSGDGLTIEGDIRLSYGAPEEVGWDAQRLQRRLDSIIQLGLTEQAFPGCQLLIAKDQKVIVHKAYGFHTYDKKQPVSLDDLYDFASVTKVTGPLPALMKLHGEGKFNLDVPFSTYWSDFNRKDKKNLIVRDILAHQAQLMPYIVYWAKTVKNNGSFKAKTFENQSSEAYPIAVSPDLYLHYKYRKKIYKAIKKSPLNEKSGYVYSGLSFLLYPQIIQDISGISFNEYVQENFYKPLGAHTLGYNPYRRFSLSRIVPTEQDTVFRKRLVHGWVHDEAAAMFDGVSGNAGLFGTVNDLAKLMQMYMNMGQYGGQEYIPSSTLKEFTAYQFAEQDNRRGLGFDKPPLKNKDQGYVAEEASEASFGHSGFTGTFTWADPKHNLLLIFFSNRVYPTRDSRKLYSLSIRPGLHQILYDEINQEE